MIFKKKTDADGNVTIYKARLVAKGYRQVQGVDYDETFSPVAKLKSVRIMLAISAYYDYEIWQMDVRTAFLNGFLKEELYMMQPEGFVDPKNAIKTFIPTPRRLHQSINGSLELAYLVSILRIDKTFRLHHIQFFLKIAVKECRFDVHLPYLIIIVCGNC